MDIKECVEQYYKSWILIKKQKKEILDMIEEILKRNLDEVSVGDVIEKVALEISNFGVVIELCIEEGVEINISELIADLDESMGVNGILTTYYGEVNLVYNILTTDGGVNV